MTACISLYPMPFSFFLKVLSVLFLGVFSQGSVSFLGGFLFFFVVGSLVLFFVVKFCLLSYFLILSSFCLWVFFLFSFLCFPSVVEAPEKFCRYVRLSFFFFFFFFFFFSYYPLKYSFFVLSRSFLPLEGPFRYSVI